MQIYSLFLSFIFWSTMKVLFLTIKKELSHEVPVKKKIQTAKIQTAKINRKNSTELNFIEFQLHLYLLSRHNFSGTEMKIFDNSYHQLFKPTTGQHLFSQKTRLIRSILSIAQQNLPLSYPSRQLVFNNWSWFMVNH